MAKLGLENTSSNPPSEKLSYKIFILIGMVYMSIFLASVTVGYKVVILGHELFCASVFIFPLLFPLNDAIVELIGIDVALNMVWFTILGEFIFVILTNSVIYLPSPNTWHHQAAYNFIIGGYFHIFIADTVAIFAGFTMNAWLLNKWKIKLKGKYFPIRSIISTSIGEFVFTVITNIIAFFKITTFSETLNIIFSDYIFKVGYSFFLCLITAFIVSYLKKKYGIKYPIANFNPFVKKAKPQLVFQQILPKSKFNGQ